VYVVTGNQQIYLSWDVVAGATGYTVQRSIDQVNFTAVGTPTVNNFTDTTCVLGTQYWYRVSSTSAAGSSGFQTMGINGQTLSAVPCLPGQINLAFLIHQSKLKTGKLKGKYVTQDEWIFNINQSANRLYDLLVTKFGENYFLAPPLQITTNGTSTYQLPDGFLYSKAPALFKLLSVEASISVGTNQWFMLSRYNDIDRDKYATLQLAGTVQSVYGLMYREMGNNLEIIPLPTNAVTLQLRYVPVLQQMLVPTDMMPFSISGWSELVILDAAIKFLIKEESFDQAQSLINERTAILDRIETTAANRNIGQPNTVSNTRARCGDSNFGMFGGFGTSGFGGGFGWGG
jgi:hypothetical protein